MYKPVEITPELREKRAAAGRKGGAKTASMYNMKKIGRLGGIEAQKSGKAHKLTREERSRGGTKSRRP